MTAQPPARPAPQRGRPSTRRMPNAFVSSPSEYLCPYNPQPVPGVWEPTPPGFTPNPLLPCWGQIRPMVLTLGARCAPPGHWMAMVGQLSRHHGHHHHGLSLITSAEAFARVGIAVHDAFIVCWYTKYVYD